MKKIMVLVLLVVLVSCAEKLMKPPENLIPKEKMVEILRDLAVLNAARSTNLATLDENEIEPMAYLYSKYEIDSAQFANSDLYYASLPRAYEDIYTKVEARLASEKEELEENKRIKDSLKMKERELKKANKDTTDSLP